MIQAELILKSTAIRTSSSSTPLLSSPTILRTYLDFLTKLSNQKAAFRFVHNRTVASQNLTFHDDIDSLLRGLNFPDDKWRQRWEGYRDSQQAAFESISRNRMALIGDLRDAQAQTEALSLLMFEFNKVNPKYTDKQLQILNNAFNIVSQFSKNKAPTIATWFLPPYEFECDPTPFAWGAFGDVHHGKHCGSDVVIKRAKTESEADRAAFVREANAWFSANQIPNVVRMFGAYHVSATPYFVCEYAANGTLNDYLFKEENRHVTWKLLWQAANGLQAVHRLQIVHNDLKCNNILVASDGIAKITGFGLSSQLSAQKALSVLKQVGALPWKAPEIPASSSPPSYASDVYAFAMCIYEAASHVVPWEGTADAWILRSVGKGKLPSRPESFTDDQWVLLESMCALNPDNRPSMDAVVKQLKIFYVDECNATISQSDSAIPGQNNQIQAIATVDEPCREPALEAEIRTSLKSDARDINGVADAAVSDESVVEVSSPAVPQVGPPPPPSSSSQGKSVVAAPVRRSHTIESKLPLGIAAGEHGTLYTSDLRCDVAL